MTGIFFIQLLLCERKAHQGRVGSPLVICCPSLPAPSFVGVGQARHFLRRGRAGPPFPSSGSGRLIICFASAGRASLRYEVS
jgi:hypothetical protein